MTITEQVEAPLAETEEPAMHEQPKNVVVGQGLAEKVAAVLGVDPETLRPCPGRIGQVIR